MMFIEVYEMSQLSLKMNLILFITAFKALDYENSF